jgi:hypothetical protein
MLDYLKNRTLLHRRSARGTTSKRNRPVEAVIGLAPNIFYGTGLAPAVVIQRRPKPSGCKRKVLIVDASRLVRKGRTQNFLNPELGPNLTQARCAAAEVRFKSEDM